MKKSTLPLVLLFFLALQAWTQVQQRDILTSLMSEQQLGNVLLSKEAFRPLPLPGDAKWDALDPEISKAFISRAEEYIGYDWPSLLAIRYMDFDINGNRTRYSSRYYDRRNAISALVMAEIIENKGRFMEDNRLQSIWGDLIFRVTFRQLNTAQEGRVTFSIRNQ